MKQSNAAWSQGERMSKILEALLQLQKVETQLSAIRRQRNAKLRRVTLLKNKLNETQERLDKNHLTARERQMRIDSLTLDVNSREQAIASQREALNKARTNKTYSEILAAINTSKADNSKLESSILQLMEELQGVQSERAGIDAELVETNQKLREAEQQLDAFDGEHREDRELLEAQREALSGGISPSALSVFTRVAEHHDGEALAAVIKRHPKRQEFSCAGCNMSITVELVNALQSREDLQTCNCCGRVLYLDATLAR